MCWLSVSPAPALISVSIQRLGRIAMRHIWDIQVRIRESDARSRGSKQMQSYFFLFKWLSNAADTSQQSNRTEDNSNDGRRLCTFLLADAECAKTDAGHRKHRRAGIGISVPIGSGKD